MTEAQKVFVAGQKILNKYERIKKERPLTEEEDHKVKEVKITLWSNIERYVMQICYRRIKNYRIANDAISDLYQACFEKFLEMLPKYNPERTAPTTFFDPRFNEAISKYIREDSQHLTHNDATNLTKVRKAINYYESMGINWNEEMISVKTKLSEKVVRNTLRYGDVSIYASDETLEYLPTKTLTPEELLLNKEKSSIIVSRITEILTPEELHIFLYKVDMQLSKDRTYNELARHFNMSVCKVKQIYSNILAKLQNDKELCEVFHYSTKSMPKLQLHDDVADELQNDIINTLTN